MGHLLAMTSTLYAYLFVDSFVSLPQKPVFFLLLVTVFLPVPSAVITALLVRKRTKPGFRNPSNLLNTVWVHFHWLIGGAALFGIWAGLYFFGNLTVMGNQTRDLYTQLDHMIPFIPRFAFIYVTVYWVFLMGYLSSETPHETVSLFKSGLAIVVLSVGIHMIFPVEFVRPELIVTDFASWGLSAIWANDNPVSCFPSTHCAMAMFAGLVIYHRRTFVGLWAMLLAVGVGISTMLTKQHYVLDVLGGFSLALIVYVLVYRRAMASEPTDVARDAARQTQQESSRT
jgi:membrane-associated phospholipid phosphatase